MGRRALGLLVAARLALAAPAFAAPDATPLDWSVRLAHDATARLGAALHFGGKRATLDYSNDLFALALIKLAERTGDVALRDYGEDIVGSFVGPDGAILAEPAGGFRLDAMPAGLVMIELYQRTGAARFRVAADAMRGRLAALPRTDDGVFAWRPHQLWLDGLWMTEPFYARYAATFGEPGGFDDIARQFRAVAQHNRDPVSHLLAHGWDERREQFWADRETGRSASFWARAIGWYAMALVDTLDALPADHRARAVLIGQVQDLAAALVRFQDPASGLWFEVVDQAARPGNFTESSASAMFVYLLAKSVNQSYLDAGYAEAARRGFAGLVRDKLVTDADERLSLTGIVRSAGLGAPPSEWPPGAMPSRRDALPGGRDGSFDYYVEQPVMADNLHGLGPFILAGIELDRLGR